MNTKSTYLDQPPTPSEITNYDREHFATYLRLLDAENEGADWEEVTTVIFGIDPSANHARAELIYQSHLARAHWMTKNGFHDLIHSTSH